MRNRWDHADKCALSVAASAFFIKVLCLRALKWLTERPVRGKEARWEREAGWEIQRRDVLWAPQTILSSDSGSLPLR